MDRDGFRCLVLLPTPRDRFILGKNLAFLPIPIAMLIIFMTLIKFIAHIPVLYILAALVQFVAAYFLTCLYGNMISILLPFRMQPGSLKPTKLPAFRQLLMMLSAMLFPLVLSPIFIPPAVGVFVARMGWLPGGPVNLFFSLGLAATVLFIYKICLPDLGRMLQQREQKILKIVTSEVE
jgi:hypothetical protein